MNKMTPFLKWAGGKTQLLDRLRERLPSEFNRYYEPFIGGGALFLDIHPNNAVINDVNMQLLNIYIRLKEDATNIVELVNYFDQVECDKEYYLQMRDRYNKKIINHELDFECAAMMIWLNKHCFNGLYRVNSKGLFNVPYNNKKSGKSIKEENLLAIGEYLKNSDVQILHGDFEDACRDAQEGDFVYFDSPYVPVSDTANFTDYTKDGFTKEDHIRLAELFKKLTNNGVKVMLSNNDVEFVHELYSGFNIESIDVRRAINSNAAKRKGREVIITNY